MNPMEIFKMMNSNPQQAIQSLIKENPNIQNNPMVKNAIDMVQKGDNAGLRNMAENMCKERGITTDQAKERIMGFFNR